MTHAARGANGHEPELATAPNELVGESGKDTCACCPERANDSDGIGHKNSRIRMAEITDGTSNTFMHLEQASTFLAAGDGRNALALLEALTDETVAEESFESWEGRDDWEDEPTGFFEELGPLWAEALLTAELTTTERAAWADTLTPRPS